MNGGFLEICLQTKGWVLHVGGYRFIGDRLVFIGKPSFGLFVRGGSSCSTQSIGPRSSEASLASMLLTPKIASKVLLSSVFNMRGWIVGDAEFFGCPGISKNIASRVG